jgi:hypothetical protein
MESTFPVCPATMEIGALPQGTIFPRGHPDSVADSTLTEMPQPVSLITHGQIGISRAQIALCSRVL